MNFPILIFGTLHLVGALLAAGILLFVWMALRPSASAVIPKGITERLLHIAAASAFLCFVSVIPLIMLVCAMITGTSLTRVHIFTFREILCVTTFGNVMIFRFCAALLLVISLYFSRHRAGRGSGIALTLSLLLLLSFGLTGHVFACRTSVLDIGVVCLHLAAVAAWPMGLFPLIIFLQRKNRDAISAAAALPVLMRFSRLSIGAVVFLALTGIANTYIIVPNLRLLFWTPYGFLLLLKILIFLIMISLGAINYFRLRRHTPSDPEARIQKIRQLITWEAILTLFILIIASLLTLTPPPSSLGG
ncbi:MAG: CopD family protein [Chthoniobacterales bacterium]